MIEFIKNWIKHKTEARIRKKCTCEHKYSKCAKKIKVSSGGVISISNYARCGIFMAKIKSQELMK